MLAPTPSKAGDFTTNRGRLWITALQCTVLGVAAALAAKLLLLLIGFITHLSYDGTLHVGLTPPDPRHWGPVSILIPVVGGLIVGLIARFGTDKIRGHGIPEAIHSILEGGSVIPARVAFFKPLASAIAIGTGGPFGAEGPIIMTGGALGSLFSQFMRLTASERRTLLVAGAAGGMSATFASPIAAVLIAVELLLFEWRPRSFIPVAVASFVAYAMRIPLVGLQPPFLVASQHTIAPGAYGWALALGVVVGLGSMLVTKFVYLVEDGYHRLPIHWMWWPAIGGAAVGVGGWFVPQALGVGYPGIAALLNGHMLVGAAAALLCVKLVIWVVSLSSGTSGGVLAPLLMIGAALGYLCASAIPGSDSAAWAVVGMAAMLGGTMRAPFMATIFAMETTHAWSLMPATFLGCMTATAITVAFVRRSILTERLARRGLHVAREYSIHPFETIAISEVMLAPSDVPTLRESDLVGGVAARLSNVNAERSGAEFAVTDDAGTIVGVVTRQRIFDSVRDGKSALSVAEIGERPFILDPGERVQRAMDVLATSRAPALAVLDDEGRWIGWVTLERILHAWRRGISLETKRSRIRSWRRPTVRIR